MARSQRHTGDYVTAGPHEETSDSQAYARTVLTLPATFSLIYESTDKRLCVFEDAAGHLNSVDASRLA